MLEEDLQDRADNQTRFYVVRKPDPTAVREKEIEEDPGEQEREVEQVDQNWKTAILFRTRNQPGALVDVLKAFSTRGVNLSKLESRPGEDPWTYRFFLELEDRGDRGAAGEAVEEARSAAQELQVLGIFRRLA